MQIILNPKNRQSYLSELLKYEGISNIQEKNNSAYCPISLTSVAEEIKPVLKKRQRVLMEILRKSGINAHDPSSFPHNPDRDLSAEPPEVYQHDIHHILSSLFFIGLFISPSTGAGVELASARFFNKISVVLIDKTVRVSRMMPSRVIYLQYVNLRDQEAEFIQMFSFLQKFTPGVGIDDNGQSILLGAKDNQSEIINLEKEIYARFPNLKFEYNPNMPNIQTSLKNPNIFEEIQ